jgi:hypothetical protein
MLIRLTGTHTRARTAGRRVPMGHPPTDGPLRYGRWPETQTDPSEMWETIDQQNCVTQGSRFQKGAWSAGSQLLAGGDPR